MGDSPTINPPFLMEFGHPNREMEEREESLSDLNTQQYNCWIDGDGKVDQLPEKKNRQLCTLEKNHGLSLLLTKIFIFAT